jgi:hypothetical protein
VGSCAAADEGNKTGGSGTSSSSLSPYTSGDLQNNRKHNRQLILICLFVQVCSRVCCSVWVCYSFLLLQATDLAVVEGVLEVEAVGVVPGEMDNGGSVGAVVCLSCSRRLADESRVSVYQRRERLKEQRRKERRTDLGLWGMLLLTAKTG